MDLSARLALLPTRIDEWSPFITAFIASALGAYPILSLLRVLKSRQTISQYAPEGHQKKQGTPTMGGLIIILGFTVAALLQITEIKGPIAAHDKSLLAQITILVLFLGFALIGFIDDYIVPRLMVGKRGLGWKQKIVMQFAVAVGSGYGLQHDSPAKLGVFVFLVLFFSNAYNFSDGLDALAGLLLVGLAGGLLCLARATGEIGLECYLMMLLGGVLPFLWLNRPKARVFMGDVGSLPIGAVLGAVIAIIAMPRFAPIFNVNQLLILGDLDSVTHVITPGALTTIGHESVRSASLGTLLALLIISGMMIAELVPVPLQILSVKVRKKKLFSFTPIHHAFERKGWPEIKVVLVFAMCQLVMSVIAVVVISMTRPKIPGAQVANRGFSVTIRGAQNSDKSTRGTLAER